MRRVAKARWKGPVTESSLMMCAASAKGANIVRSAMHGLQSRASARAARGGQARRWRWQPPIHLWQRAGARFARCSGPPLQAARVERMYHSPPHAAGRAEMERRARAARKTRQAFPRALQAHAVSLAAQNPSPSAQAAH
eukprot:scaffold12443_cov108-Isochrysis_galbana.AAC.5